MFPVRCVKFHGAGEGDTSKTVTNQLTRRVPRHERGARGTGRPLGGGSVQIHGQTHSRRSLAERVGNLAQIGGVRLSTLEDGPGRGVRVLDFDTGGGLRFTVNVDRAMDIGALSHNGRSVGWQSAAGTRHPAYNDQQEDGGRGWNRSFSGFLATCGLDHILGAEEVTAETYGAPGNPPVRHGQHGRIANTPARLSGYGERWEGETCVLWAEGTATQAALFGEVLHLTRRIEADLGGTDLRIVDRVTNGGFALTPHMLLYHVNLGFPLLDEGSRYVAPIREVIFATHAADGLEAQGVGYRRCPAPVAGFAEQVWQHDMAADGAGVVPVLVANDRLGMGLLMETRAADLPCAYQWQCFRAGQYVMGIEAATHHVKGNGFARARGEMIWLEPGESREYALRFSMLEGAERIAAAEARVRAIAAPPEEEYPQPTNRFPPLYGAQGGPA